MCKIKYICKNKLTFTLWKSNSTPEHLFHIFKILDGFKNNTLKLNEKFHTECMS